MRHNVLFIKEEDYVNEKLFSSHYYNTINAVSIDKAQYYMDLNPNIIVFVSVEPIGEVMEFISRNRMEGRFIIACNAIFTFYYQFIYAGVDRFFLFSDSNKIIRAIQKVVIDKSKESLYCKVVNILLESGIPHACKGYKYLIDTIIHSIEQSSLAKCSFREIYAIVAKKYGTIGKNVERDIRHAINVACCNEKIYGPNTIFTKIGLTRKEKLTNTVFIASVFESLAINHF